MVSWLLATLTFQLHFTVIKGMLDARTPVGVRASCKTLTQMHHHNQGLSIKPDPGVPNLTRPAAPPECYRQDAPPEPITRPNWDLIRLGVVWTALARHVSGQPGDVPYGRSLKGLARVIGGLPRSP